MDRLDLEELLAPFVAGGAVPPGLFTQLELYLELLLKWNARTNLTAIRDPREIVLRHFGESLFLGVHLPPCRTLLDYGSGAGFPGLPVQLLLPELRVTLAESQNKKAAFLREAVRSLALPTTVWSDRVEAMAVATRFDVVALRAVDKMDDAIVQARLRVAPGGTLALLRGRESGGMPVPGGDQRSLVLITCP